MSTRPPAAPGFRGLSATAAGGVDPAADDAPSGPAAGWLRLLRVAGLGVPSLLLAGSAHLAAGGRMPGVVLSLLLVAAAGTVGVLITARRCRLPVLLAVLGVQQVLLHLVLSRSSPMTCAASMTMPAGHDPVMPMCSAAAELPAADHLSFAMVSAHVLATVLTAWLLARGEAALWTLAERIVQAAGASPTPWPHSAPRVGAMVPPSVLVPAIHRDDASPRGPPARTAAIS